MPFTIYEAPVVNIEQMKAKAKAKAKVKTSHKALDYVPNWAADMDRAL